MCTVFNVWDESGNNIYVGKNYDVRGEYNGMVFINNPKVYKEAFLLNEKNPVKWLSEYGSITFSQISKEFPTSGMNEKGLIVEQNFL